MGEQGKTGAGWDAKRLVESEKEFWAELWRAPVGDAVYEMGIDMVRFGPIQAGCVASQADASGLNFLLGAGEAGSVEHGHLADAVDWLESRCVDYDARGVDYRVPVVPGLAATAAAEDWLRSRGNRREEGPAKLVRAASPPGFDSPPGIEVVERTDWDEGFGDPLAESLGLPGAAATHFLNLLGREGWRCYCAVGDDEPLAYAAMLVLPNTAEFALASCPSEGRDGRGQAAVLHRCVVDAAGAGCDMLVVADAGREPPAIDRDCLVTAGFEVAYRIPTWRAQTRVAV